MLAVALVEANAASVSHAATVESSSVVHMCVCLVPHYPDWQGAWRPCACLLLSLWFAIVRRLCSSAGWYLCIPYTGIRCQLLSFEKVAVLCGWIAGARCVSSWSLLQYRRRRQLGGQQEAIMLLGPGVVVCVPAVSTCLLLQAVPFPWVLRSMCQEPPCLVLRICSWSPAC